MMRNTFLTALFLCVPLGSPAAGEAPDRLWGVRWFNRDRGHENDFVLQPDGSPVCGSENCPTCNSCARCDAACWCLEPASASGSTGSVSWNIAADGSLSVGYDRDHQIRVDTWLGVDRRVALHPEVRNASGLWVNGARASDSSCLDLRAGWNHVVYTSYHQHEGASLEITLDLVSRVRAMDSQGRGECRPAPACATPPQKFRRVNVDSQGHQSTAGADHTFAMTPDGRFVAFSSGATNLIEGRETSGRQVFLHDRDPDEDGVFDETGAISTALVSTSAQGVPADADGVFDEPGATATAMASVDDGGNPGNHDSGAPTLSADGRFVAFASPATNLDPPDEGLNLPDIFVHDRVLGTTRRITRSAGQDLGASSPAISADGRFVAYTMFSADAPAQVWVHDRDRDADRNGVFDETGGYGTVRVSVDCRGNEANEGSGFWTYPEVALSGGGCFVVFQSSASNLAGDDTNGATDLFDYSTGGGWCCDGCESLQDCNHNGIDDREEITSAAASDCNRNGLPDECDLADCVPAAYLDPAGASGEFVQGDCSFADLVLHYDPAFTGGCSSSPRPAVVCPEEALGPPDFDAAAGTGTVSLGIEGVLELVFADNAAANSGDDRPDLVVFEAFLLPSGFVEPFMLAVRPTPATAAILCSERGVACSVGEFVNLGRFDGGTSRVDLDAQAVLRGYPAGRLLFDAVRIVDAAGECNDTPGADIDAVGALFSVPLSHDCNQNGIPDLCDVGSGRSRDANGDGVPDECVPSEYELLYCLSCDLRFTDGLQGSGQPVDNRVTAGTASLAPVLTGSSVELCSGELGPCGLQVPGDCTQDSNLDLSDAVCVLGVLFRGQPERFPCGDGSRTHRANLRLLDWQPDEAVDISDAVLILRFLFSGGRPHRRAVPGAEKTGCVALSGCPETGGCARAAAR